MTEDHTLIAWQLKQGLITPQEAVISPHRNVITRAVGSRDYVEVDTRIVGLTKGDRFLLCSDGLHGYLQLDEIAAVGGIGGEQAVDQFIALANNRGGKDNITAVMVHVGGCVEYPAPSTDQGGSTLTGPRWTAQGPSSDIPV